MINSRLFRNIFLATILVILIVNFAIGAVKLVKGQTLYLPSYSNIIVDHRTITLRVNLIIHNTDPVHKITIVRIDSHNTNGKLVEKILPESIDLDPLAAIRFTIKDPQKGDMGAGANFIVQWRADHKVTEPLIECIMAGSQGTQGHTFASQGRIIQEESD